MTLGCQFFLFGWSSRPERSVVERSHRIMMFNNVGYNSCSTGFFWDESLLRRVSIKTLLSEVFFRGNLMMNLAELVSRIDY